MQKTEFVALRMTPEQVSKLRALALSSGKGLNVSEAVRTLVDRAPEPTINDLLSGIQNKIGSGGQHA